MSDQPEDAEDVVKELAKKAHDLDAVRKSVEDAASVSGTLWFSYLFALFYIGIAAGGVTHRDLLLENAVKLPFLNVDLPLVAFFALAPILFVISHAYTLMHFVLLGAKVGTFNIELGKKVPDPDAAPTKDISPDRAAELRETRLGLRRQLPSNIFVQFLAGPRDIRDGGLGWFLKAVAWISLVIGPVLLLLLLQIQFLPYHLAWVTWVQRFALLADMSLLWLLWPAIMASRSAIQWPRLSRHRFLTLASLIPVGLAFTAATFPGEWVDEYVGKKKWIPPITAWLGGKNPKWTSFHDILFYGEIDDISRRRRSVFSNTLVLPRFDAWAAPKIDDPKRLETIHSTLSLWRRNLDEAILYRANLRKVDLVRTSLLGASLDYAQLQGASLDYAQLQGASLDHAQLQGASLDYAELQGASLDHAQLQGASLVKAHLKDALLRSADLHGALLNDAQLQGADFGGPLSFYAAQLQGVSLDNARLQGVSLSASHLEGASLDHAQLQGALLDYAQLQGASLANADLGGASLSEADLRGASLDDAELQGASFYGAQLQGADFGKAILAGTNMDSTEVWRARFVGASLTAVFEDNMDQRANSMDEFAALKATIMKEVPEGKRREEAMKRIDNLNPDIFGPEASEQEKLEKGRVDITAYRSALAVQLNSLACEPFFGRVVDDAIYAVRGLIHIGNLRIRVQRLREEVGSRLLPASLSLPSMAPDLIEKILGPDCFVSAALTEDDKAALKKIARSSGVAADTGYPPE